MKNTDQPNNGDDACRIVLLLRDHSFRKNTRACVRMVSPVKGPELRPSEDRKLSGLTMHFDFGDVALPIQGRWVMRADFFGFAKNFLLE